VGAFASVVFSQPVSAPAKPLTPLAAFPKGTTDALGETVVSIQNSIISAELFTRGVLAMVDAPLNNQQQPRLRIASSKITGDLAFSDKQLRVNFEFDKVTFTGNVNFHTSTFSDLIIADSAFEKDASFQHASFSEAASFNNVTFQQRADFASASFVKSGYFTGTTFKGYALFDYARFGANAGFAGVSLAAGGSFFHVRVRAQALFKGATFNGTAALAFFEAGSGDFSYAVFNDWAVFNSSRFITQVDFVSTIFNADADFESCEFPLLERSKCTGGVSLYHTRFEKRLWLPFKMLVDSKSWLPFANPAVKLRHCAIPGYERTRLLHDLKDKYKSAGDLEALNDAEYFENVALTRDDDATRRQRFSGYVSEYVWGYGFRPWRPLFWLFASIVVCALIYLTQTEELTDQKDRWQWKRLRFAWLFSWKSAFKLKPITDQARNLRFKVLIFGQWLISKILLLLFIKSLSTNTPIVGDLVDKVIPF
jgi:hypothetical protein